MDQAGNLLNTMEKIKANEDCLFLLTTITEKFSFVFFSKPCLIFHRLSPNHFLVNLYKLLCYYVTFLSF